MSGNGLGVRRIRSGLNISGSGWQWVGVDGNGWEHGGYMELSEG